MNPLATPMYKDILPYIEKGLVKAECHPEDKDVVIFNYTNECQLSHAWDSITTQCRGLILNIKTGEVIARPFRKFFNLDEHLSHGGTIPNEVPIITEKMDGSLGILYCLNGKYRIATRGSFVSEQAIWATHWWQHHMTDTKLEGTSGREYTHMFEIIYPANKVVVAYPFSGLVHIGTQHTQTGEPVNFQWKYCAIRKPAVSKMTTLEKLVALDE